MDLGYGYLQLLSGDGCLWGWNQRDEEPLNLYRIDTSHEDALSAEPVASLDWASEPHLYAFSRNGRRQRELSAFELLSGRSLFR